MQNNFINQDLPNIYEGNFIEDGYTIIRDAILKILLLKHKIVSSKV